MDKIILHRKRYTDWGTFGSFTAGGNKYYTVECPYRDNTPEISCIPLGSYKVFAHNGNKYKNVWILDNVPGRSGILIHWGNWAGDTSKGFKSNSNGCILVGKGTGIITHKDIPEGQEGITSSMAAVEELRKIWTEPFLLQIVDVQSA